MPPDEAASAATAPQADGAAVAADEGDGDGPLLARPVGVTAEQIETARDGRGRFVSNKEKAQDDAYSQFIAKNGAPQGQKAPKRDATRSDDEGPGEGDDGDEGRRSAPRGKPDAAAVEADIEGRAQRRQMDRARHALRRNGLYSESEIAEMPEDQVLRLGKRAAEQIARRERDYARSQRAQTGTDAQRGTPAESGTDARGLPPERRTAPRDGDGHPGGQPDPLDELLDGLDDNAGANAPAESEAPDPKQTALTRELLAERTENVRLSLVEEFPLLREERFQRLVYDEMNDADPTMRDAQRRDSLHSLMRRACLVVFGDQIAREARDRSAENSRAARAGQPFHGIKTQPGKPATGTVDRKDHDRVRDLAYEAMTKAKTPAERREFMRQRMKT